MPVEKRSKKKHNAEEEEEEDDKTYEPSESDVSDETDEESGEAEEEEENENENNDTDQVSSDEEELSPEAKSLKDVALETKAAKKTGKRKASSKDVSPSKKLKVDGKKKTTVTKTGKKERKDETKESSKEKVDERKVKTVKATSTKKTKGSEVEEEKKKDGEEPKEAEEGKKKVVEYNDKNVDYNLYNEAPDHIKNVKIKLSSNVVMMCRMIEASGNAQIGLTFDYAALSFVRQSKNGRAYEFNLPLGIAKKIIQGCQLCIKENPKFFEKQQNASNPERHQAIERLQ